MNFKISKRMFLNAINKVALAISPNSPLPSLSGVLIKVKNDRIVLVGSNADISIEKTLLASDEDLKLDIIDEGEIVIESKYLTEIIRRFEDEIIQMEIVDGSLTRIQGEKIQYKINGIRSVEYPSIDFGKPAVSFELDSDMLLRIISQTTFAASDKEQRPVLTGVHIKLKDNTLTCIATDSFRLSRKQLTLESDVNTEITIPASTLNDIAKIIEKNTPITIATDGRKAQFYIDTYLVQTRLLDGSYPETDRLIPTEFKYEIEIGSRELLNAIDRGALFKNDGISIVKMVAVENNLELSSQSQEVGSYMENIIASNVIGDGIKLSFSGKYVTDAIKALGCSLIKVQFSGEMKPFLIKDVEDETILQLVLPVRTYN